jgi:hypothetical protein
MKIYLAGPMRGIPEFNLPAFAAGAEALRALGHEVFSPVEHDKTLGFSWAGTGGNLAEEESKGFSLRKALGDDLAWICAHADAVVVLPGWARSLGATAEAAVAEALGLDVYELDGFLKGDV